MITIAPSLLSADFSAVKEELVKLKQAKIEYVHFDVMDNHFVPNLTFGPKFIKDLRKYSDVIFDVHLMIESPEKSIEPFLESGGDIYTFHIEATNHVLELAKKVKGQNRKFALSIKPDTPMESIYPYLELLDMVLIMTVEPGFGGQSLIEKTLIKISELKNIIAKRNLPIKIQVDGGINLDTVAKVVNHGAEILVMGSAFFKNEDYVAFIASVYQKIENSRNEKITVS